MARPDTAARTAGDLTPAPYNPRQIADEHLEQLGRAMVRFGDLSGIVRNRRTGHTVGGHQRLKHIQADAPIRIARRFKTPNEQGTVAVGYILVDGEWWGYREVDWDDETERAANIAANKHGGEWDLPALGDLMRELQAGGFEDVQLLGFSEKEFDRLIAATAGPARDEAPDVDLEPPAEPKSRRGEVYELGAHRVMCGDATSAEDVTTLLNGATPRVTLTDPPYSVDYDRSHEQRGGQASVHKDYQEGRLGAAEVLAFLTLVPSSVVVMSYPVDRHLFELADALRRARLELRKELVWVKDTFSFWPGAQYQQRHEPILVCARVGSSIDADVPPNVSTVFDVPRPKAHDLHPTAKPLELWSQLVKYHLREGEGVYDPFAGSGTTVIAAEQNGRICYAMELAAGYVDVIRRRYARFVGRSDLEP